MSNTTTHGAPYPESGDTPSEFPIETKALAEWADDQLFGAVDTGAGGLGGLRALLADRWSHDASSPLAGADVRATQGATTDIIVVNFTLDRARPVLLGARARAVNIGSNVGLWGLAITIDGTFDSQLTAGPDQALAPPGNDVRSSLVIEPTIRVLGAGAHVIRLQADRDGNGTLDVTGGVTFNSRGYRPTHLTVVYQADRAGSIRAAPPTNHEGGPSMLDRKTLLSWEFLALALSNIAAWAATMAENSIGTNSAVYWTAGSVGVYALVRGLAKVNHDHKDWWQTPEFALAILASATTTLAALQDVINAHTYGILMGILLTLTGLGNGIRKVPAVQADAGDPPTAYDPDYGDQALDPGQLEPAGPTVPPDDPDLA